MAFLVGAVVVVGAAALGTAVAFVWVRKQVVEVLRARRRRALPPQVRMPVTLVSTDIAGSTELWEWDTQQAAEVGCVLQGLGSCYLPPCLLACTDALS